MQQGFGHTGPRHIGEGELKWQVRINLSDEFAAVARENAADPRLQPLLDVLAKYDAVIKHQTMSFAGFLPYFKDIEKPELLKKISDALQAMEDADERNDVSAALAALETYREATDHFIERYGRMYLWTKSTLQRPGIDNKYATRFTIYANGGEEIYDKATADGLEADLQPLRDSGMITKIDKFDSDPANNPQAPPRFHV